MATYTAEPKIHLSINFGDRWLMLRFDDWFLESFKWLPRYSVDISQTYGKHARSGYFAIPDAEKVVEWLKAHGVEHR